MGALGIGSRANCPLSALPSMIMKKRKKKFPLKHKRNHSHKNDRIQKASSRGLVYLNKRAASLLFLDVFIKGDVVVHKFNLGLSLLIEGILCDRLEGLLHIDRGLG